MPINSLNDSDNLYQKLTLILKDKNFLGEICSDQAELTIGSQDNSIYELKPDLIVYPKATADVALLLKQLNLEPFKKLKVTARGKSTGTNAQSLNRGIIIDFSKYFNKILNFDRQKKLITVQAGAVLDDINNFLKKYDLIFPIKTSTANRATIGGMFNTNASGQGSLTYGRTVDFVQEVEFINHLGDLLNIKAGGKSWQLAANNSWWSTLIVELEKIFNQNKKHFAKYFKDLGRSLYGYDLKNFKSASTINPLSILCGSESTLGISTQITVKLDKIIKHKAIILLQYDDFLQALASGKDLIKLKPLSVETMDETCMRLAATDRVFLEIKDQLKNINNQQALNIVEISAETPSELEKKLQKITAILKKSAKKYGRTVFFTKDQNQIAAIWKLRSRGVGLLSKLSKNKVASAFVEDAVVPINNLPSFIKEFKSILDKHKLTYAFYGHLDVGCVHVRPALDYADMADKNLINIISKQVNSLVLKNEGILWGEHGKGVRAFFAKDYFGDELYNAMLQIKNAFDPENRFNPGKLFSADKSQPIYKIDELTYRLKKSAALAKNVLTEFYDAFKCDSNAECLSVNSYELMCPSYKITNDRQQSPLGRARLFREWLQSEDEAIKSELKLALDKSFKTCLSCKACTGLCPTGVDVAKLKSQFLNINYKNKIRPVADYATINLERLLPIVYKIKPVANLFLALINNLAGLQKLLNLKDLPYLKNNNYLAKFKLVKNTDVLIVPDAFNYYYEPEIMAKSIKLLNWLGLKTHLHSYTPNGKGAYIKGDFSLFRKESYRHIESLAIVKQDVKYITSLEPSIALTYTQEHQINAAKMNVKITSIEKIIYDQLLKNKNKFNLKNRNGYILFNHCSVNACFGESNFYWKEIFNMLGLNLTEAKVGCCGMAGIYGQQEDQYDNSKAIYKYSWHDAINQAKEDGLIPLVTGFSCRKQVARFSGVNLYYPLSILADLI